MDMNKKMDIETRIKERLTIGQVIRNYREMCKILDEEIKGGNAKKAQLKEWKRYLKFNIDKYKFIILEIYEIPLPKLNNINGNNNKYGNLIDDLIIQILKKDIQLEDTFKKIFTEKISIYSNSFKNINNDQYAEELNITNGFINKYQELAQNKIQKSFESSLNRLQKQNLIEWTKAFVLFKEENNNNNNNSNPISLIKENNDGAIYRIIKRQEKEAVNELNKELSKEKGEKSNINMYNIMLNQGLANKFNKIMSKKLNVDKYWSIYCIYSKTNNNDIDNFENNLNHIKLKDSKEIDSIVKKLTSNIIKGIHKSINDIQNIDKTNGEKYYMYRSDRFYRGLLKMDDIIFKHSKEINKEEIQELDDIWGKFS